MCADIRLSNCPSCRGHGPHARKDGHRFDSAPDAACPDCGATRATNRAQRIEATLSLFRQVLELLEQDELEGQLAQLQRKAECLDPRGRPSELEVEDLPPYPVHPAAALTDEEVRNTFLTVSIDLHRGEEYTLMRKLLMQLAPAYAAEEIECSRRFDEEKAARAARQAEAQQAQAQANEKRAQRQERIRQAWQAYLERHADKVQALRESQAPVELPRGQTMWLALGPDHNALGAGSSIEEAHRAAVEGELEYLTLEYLGELTQGPDEDDEQRLPYGRITSYVRVQGPRAAVRGIAHRAELL